ncbi:MAG: bacillithiol system redox-active protein YtxJ [Flavobacteriaceae bacterium]|nr:bacillithiol system redox-active protein YtxJ [Flavobacteriaceae bacterium]
MSIFNSIFGEPKPNSSSSNIKWTPMEHLGQIDEIIALSEQIPVIIFKHSTRCSISRMALKNFENEYDLGENVAAYFLDLISFREVSNEIATRFNVVHQSPQLLLIVGGKSVYDVSHSSIDAQELKSKIQ